MHMKTDKYMDKESLHSFIIFVAFSIATTVSLVSLVSFMAEG